MMVTRLLEIDPIKVTNLEVLNTERIPPLNHRRLARFGSNWESILRLTARGSASYWISISIGS